MGRTDFSDQLRKIIIRYKRIGYNSNAMRQFACLFFNPITVNNYASLFNFTPVGRAFPELQLFILVGYGLGFLSVAWLTGVQLMILFLLQIPSGVVWLPRDLQLPGNTLHPSNPLLCSVSPYGPNNELNVYNHFGS